MSAKEMVAPERQQPVTLIVSNVNNPILPQVEKEAVFMRLAEDRFYNRV
jgi:hypothetical protein